MRIADVRRLVVFALRVGTLRKLTNAVYDAFYPFRVLRKLLVYMTDF